MKPCSFLAMACLLAACEPGPDQAAAPPPPPENADWVVLFDGTSLDAFRGFRRDDIPGSWAVDGDALAFRQSDDGGDLITKEEFGDFELALEWKISPGGNSGIIYRATEEFDTPWKTGPEYQLLDNAGHPDALNGADRMAGANYDVNPADSAAVRPAGEWNSTRILARGPHVEHWLNGQMVADYELYSEAWKEAVAASKWVNYPEYGQRLSGYIALQDHGNPIWFRNIRIRRL